jgi:phosphoribosylformimino-5-aminoimidazole carboxamide ribotide isomerase
LAIETAVAFDRRWNRKSEIGNPKSAMTIYPAIDLKGGRAVRLLQGRADQETVYAERPADVADVFRAAGSRWVHVVDLDGAFSGEPRNLAHVEAIVALGLQVQLGGGLRDRAAVERALALGVARVVIGTRAAESEPFIAELVQAFGERIAVGIDAKDGKVAVKGWVDTTGTGALDLARRMDHLGVRTIIYTDIGTDGMLTGPNLPAQEAMAAAVQAQVIASGGVSRREDVVALAEIEKRRPNLGGVIVGKALYEKRVDLKDLLSIRV